MNNYEMTVENGVITWINSCDEIGAPIEGILYIPSEAVEFTNDAWVFLGYELDGISVAKDNPVFSSAHNCLLSKDGKRLIKACKNSDVSSLVGLETIGRDAFGDLLCEKRNFGMRIPDSVKRIDYRAFAMNAAKADITVPESVEEIDFLAFMISGGKRHITFEGDPKLATCVFGTKAEAEECDNEDYKAMPDFVRPKVKGLVVSCKKGTEIYSYCKRYGIKIKELRC